MFQDLPESFLFPPDKVKRTKFIASGGYGAVFKGTITDGNSTREIAIKVPKNTDACGTKNSDALRNAERNQRMKNEAPTYVTGEIYKYVFIAICWLNAV